MKAGFGQLGGVVAPDVLEQGVLDAVMVGDVGLFAEPIEVTAGSPIGDVAFGHGVAAFIHGLDDSVIVCAISNHTIDHVPAVPGEAGDVAVTADFARRSGGWRNFDNGDDLRLGRGSRGGRSGRDERLGRDEHGQKVWSRRGEG